MIGRLAGEILEKQPPFLLIDVNGVGYEVEAPMSTFYQLPEVGERVILQIHMVVREDAQLLFGFASKQERTLFRTLIKVNGVGAKLALGILSGISSDEFARSVQDNDSATLVKLPGIGKKTAERLIIEMRDRLADWQPSETTATTTTKKVEANHAAGDAYQEAVSALISLGYKPQEASRLVSSVDGDGLDSEGLIRAALKAAVTK
jgi:Holliday junction DNA helicase RuvA